MAASSRNGRSYERKIAHICAQYCLTESPIALVRDAKLTAGSTHASDIVLQYQHANDDNVCHCGIEIKNSRATECGQRALIVGRRGLELPRCDENITHRRYLESFVPFNGRVPSFMKDGNRDVAQWRAEKANFADQIVPVESQFAIAEYYHSHGSEYIQIGGKGLYRTSEDDPLRASVPILECESHIRIRCKNHGKRGSCPSSVQACFVMHRASLSRSPFDLEREIVPESFAHVARNATIVSETEMTTVATSQPTTTTTTQPNL